ncbi:MAG: hypothetical protein EXS36_08585 [Pedosphaera sp.]|nr:hypothetical protein [Pedosphaera sp.]
MRTAVAVGTVIDYFPDVCLRQKTLSPLLRSLAALALGVFVVAQSLCFLHCNSFDGSGDKARPSCHGSPKSPVAQNCHGHDGHDRPTPSAPSTSLMCPTLKTLLAGSDTPPLVAPPLHTLYLLVLISLAMDSPESQREASFSCQAHTRDWVFTPEVCLGPAFRSLAPPFVG